MTTARVFYAPLAGHNMLLEIIIYCLVNRRVPEGVMADVLDDETVTEFELQSNY